MEPLWNRQGATSGKRSARQVRKNGLSSDETVATSWHGKEGVDGSSPSEGSAKAPQNGASRMCSVGVGASEGLDGAVYGAFASRRR